MTRLGLNGSTIRSVTDARGVFAPRAVPAVNMLAGFRTLTQVAPPSALLNTPGCLSRVGLSKELTAT